LKVATGRGPTEAAEQLAQGFVCVPQGEAFAAVGLRESERQLRAANQEGLCQAEIFFCFLEFQQTTN